jgi:hypothetical protein
MLILTRFPLEPVHQSSLGTCSPHCFSTFLGRCSFLACLIFRSSAQADLDRSLCSCISIKCVGSVSYTLMSLSRIVFSKHVERKRSRQKCESVRALTCSSHIFRRSSSAHSRLRSFPANDHHLPASITLLVIAMSTPKASELFNAYLTPLSFSEAASEVFDDMFQVASEPTRVVKLDDTAEELDLFLAFVVRSAPHPVVTSESIMTFVSMLLSLTPHSALSSLLEP